MAGERLRSGAPIDEDVLHECGCLFLRHLGAPLHGTSFRGEQGRSDCEFHRFRIAAIEVDGQARSQLLNPACAEPAESAANDGGGSEPGYQDIPGHAHIRQGEKAGFESPLVDEHD